MTEALRLSVMSGEISAAAAHFVSADNVRATSARSRRRSKSGRCSFAC